MAGKKPAKKNISNSQKEIKIELPGKAIKYMGMKGVNFTCPTCNRSLVKGIIWEHEGSAYCQRGCIPKKQELVA
jgi:hypothetical protein